ncbi:MAG TPA: hypothetical protein VEK34_13910 [Methylocella sp.]|nr:hypothetical protein [Methylocella sp.]
MAASTGCISITGGMGWQLIGTLGGAGQFIIQPASIPLSIAFGSAPPSGNDGFHIPAHTRPFVSPPFASGTNAYACITPQKTSARVVISTTA